jgi:lysophospholipase
MSPAAECLDPVFLNAGAVRIRAGRFDVPQPRGLCLLLNGQSEYIEKYFEVIDELRGRGLSVVSFDWRGQGGSERLLPNPRKAHIADFADYDQDLDTVTREIVQPLARQTALPVIAMAHSMGGHLLIRRLHDAPDEFRCAVLCAPMIKINPRGYPWWVVERIAIHLNRKMPSTEFVWGAAGRDQLTLPFAEQIVTSDPDRYARTQAVLKADPELRINGPTWGWMAAALRSIALLNEPGYAEAIRTPTLLFGAGHDQICDTSAIRDFAARMPDADFVEIAGSEHEILMERDHFRVQLWNAFDQFLRRKLAEVCG